MYIVDQTIIPVSYTLLLFLICKNKKS